MRTAEDFVLSKPFSVDWTEKAQRHHRVLAEKDVVDEALKVVRVVAVGHHVRRVGRRQPERVRKLVRLVRKGSDPFLQARLVAELLEIRMIGRDARRVEKLDHTRVQQRIEIATQEQLSVRRIGFIMAGTKRMTNSVLSQLFQLLQNRLNPFIHPAEQKKKNDFLLRSLASSSAPI